MTGGAAGIGRAIAERLLASGGSVTLWDRDRVRGRQAAERLGEGCTCVLLEVAQEDSAKIALGRFGQPEKVAALVGWLCTEECAFSTGAVFDLSGGRATS